MVTVGPQEEFVKRVGGDRVNVTVIVPSGADPHTYEPLPNQMKQVQDAQIYFQVGSGIEFELSWMDKIASMNPEMKLVNTSEGITLLPNTAEQEEGSDPHVWVSPKNAKIMVDNIYQTLIQTDPENKDYYTENRDEYLKELDELDKNITQTLSGKNNTKIMVYHPAWAYFCRDYNLQQIAIESEGKEPTPQEIANLVDEARADNIKIIFVTPEFSSSNAEVIANEIGGKVVVVDPLDSNYLENMQKVAEAFAST
ncbi:metal ABC transporter solute-binding protein, Zn/Mn family [Methanobacterium ferruginis]|uniref:metal ABC transporter solute-binding protein, Zn/Mn family n=1 Tax=Methanobacterium ferruginis TaxID=710191 RepID=UPI00257316A2|nr:zinc ABC transporter substrate-binding protein [Methanobacterium ferruginis]BDZ68900.1 adhesin [Methanobacterium ferruginis]